MLVRLVRASTRSLVFRKTLPSGFGSGRIYVTPRSDLRLLVPGWATTSADLLQVAERYVRPGACVWDIGSNLGVFSACAAWKAGPQGRVCAVEADPAHVVLQQRTFRQLPKTYARIDVLCAAVADRVAMLELAIPHKGHARAHLSTLTASADGGTEYTKQVVAVTADFLLQYWAPPDVIKIDIEGAEALFLRGATHLLTRVRPIMYLEVSEANVDAVSAILKTSGYRLFDLEHSSETPIEKCAFNTLAHPA